MFVELHVIQSFAPSNLNRDDTGNPKDAEFGGVRRARVSSQSLKRAIRLAPVFAKTTEVEPAKRTRRVVGMLRKPLKDAGKNDEEINVVLDAFVTKYLSKLETQLADNAGADDRTRVLIYISDDEIQAIAAALLAEWEGLVKGETKVLNAVTRDLVKRFSNVTSAPDIALFGRMLAQQPVLNIDAACQVAHALSTHRVTMEMDFWTAVDDLQPNEESGAGMMGFTGFDSACFYRYVHVDWEQLVENLGGDTGLARKTIEGFMRALVEAIPSGKQNTFAAQNPPDLMLAVVRDGSFAWSLTNAFERPVRPGREGGLVAPSVRALDTYWGRLNQVYGSESVLASAALVLDPDLPLSSLAGAVQPNLDAWVGSVTNALPAEEV